MYKDKAKQREANRKIQAKRRKGVTKQGVMQGVTGYGNGTCVTPEYPQVSDQEFTKLMAQAGPDHVRVSKPGDADYEPQCETTRAFVEGAEGLTQEEKAARFRALIADTFPGRY